MAERVNPPILGVPFIDELKELQRKLGVHLKHEEDASPIWNEYVWSYAVDFYKLFHAHYSKFPHFASFSEDAAIHNAVVSTLAVIRKQIYNFNSVQPAYERSILERLQEHIKQERIRNRLLIPPEPEFKGLSYALKSFPALKAPSLLSDPPSPQEIIVKSRQDFVLPRLREKGWDVAAWAQKANVSRHTANGYLDGSRKTYHSSMKLLAAALGVSFHEFPK